MALAQPLAPRPPWERLPERRALAAWDQVPPVVLETLTCCRSAGDRPGWEGHPRAGHGAGLGQGLGLS